MKTLYFDCFAGASGDMILGALIALGVDRSEFLRQIGLLGFRGYEIKFETVDRSGLSAIKAHVRVPHEHKHRHLSQIVEIIDRSSLSDKIKSRATEIFINLGRAEAKMHNIPLEKVHFHEVGAMDAIIDIVGACVGFEMLGIKRFCCSKINVGSGFVKMAHGTFPVPPPAVAELLKSKLIYSSDIVGELVTPTGAAIIATVCSSFGAIPEMIIERAAYGAGTRQYKDFPNVLRLITGEIAENTETSEKLCLIETNLDDVSGQTAGFVLERAFAENALDCWITPIQMKKNRPAFQISILCRLAEREKFAQILFDQTTTLGVRTQIVERFCLPREFETVTTQFGEIQIKIVRENNSIRKFAPEYEQCRRAAIQHGVPLAAIERAAILAFEKNNKTG
jgi:uncharacterized protein (TIGR00299 family) protein